VVTLCATRFNIHKLYVLPTQRIYVFCVDLRTNSVFSIQHWVTGFYNRDGVCLLCGTDWIFKQNILRFVLKGFKTPRNHGNISYCLNTYLLDRYVDVIRHAPIYWTIKMVP